MTGSEEGHALGTYAHTYRNTNRPLRPFQRLNNNFHITFNVFYCIPSYTIPNEHVVSYSLSTYLPIHLQLYLTHKQLYIYRLAAERCMLLQLRSNLYGAGATCVALPLVDRYLKVCDAYACVRRFAIFSESKVKHWFRVRLSLTLCTFLSLHAHCLSLAFGFIECLFS